MYKFTNRKVHHTLTGEITVVQVRKFINFLTSYFDSSTRGERDTILKSFSYHTMLTKLTLLGTSCGASDLLSSSPVGTRKTQPYASTVETQTSQHHGQNSTSTVRLHGPSRLLTRPVPFGNQLDWSPVNYQLDWPTIKTQLTSFSKSQNSQPIASRNDVIHTPAQFISGVYYDNCDCHILCAQTWTVPNVCAPELSVE